MLPSPRSFLLLLALALAGPAAASPRIAIGPVKGDARGDLGAQLIGSLCVAHRCIPGALSGARPDPERARRRMGVEGSIVASVGRERGGWQLSLALFTTGRRPARTWLLPLGADRRLTPDQLEQLARELDAALGVAPPPAPPRPAAPPPVPREPSATPAPAPAPLALAPRATAPAGPRSPPPPPPPPPAGSTPPLLPASPPARNAAPPRRPSTDPWLSLEAGVEPTRRSLRFPAGGTAPVGYRVDLPAAPRVRLELHPFRPAGFGLFAEGTYLPGIGLPAGTRVHRAALLRLRGGLTWRLRLADGLVLEPALAYERESFVVGAGGGLEIPGLPDTRLAGGSAALAVELGGPRLALLGGGRVTWWLDARELAGGASFFPGGQAHTLDAEAGLGVALAGPFSLRALGHYAVTRWRLDADPSGAFAVDSARAESWGARVSLRLAL